MRKIYESRGCIIGNMTLIVGGKPMIVSFQPVTSYTRPQDNVGDTLCSRLSTNIKALQYALEHHPSFNRSYRLVQVIEEPQDRAPKKEVAANDSIKTIAVASPAEARDYLKENYNVTFRGFVSAGQIKEKAEGLGIKFEGI